MYILIQTDDLVENGGDFTLPESYGLQTIKDQSGTYLLVDDQSTNDASDISYTPGAAYDAWVLAEFPDAPNGTQNEAALLGKTAGASGTAWWDGGA